MQSRNERTRTRILEAARKEFSLHGFEAMGVAETCETAGVSKGTFYHHFPTKQAAFLELLHTWLAYVEEQLQATSQVSRSVPLALQEMSSMVGQVFQAAGHQVLYSWNFGPNPAAIRKSGRRPLPPTIATSSSSLLCSLRALRRGASAPAM